MDQNTKNKISKSVNKAYENQALRKHMSRVGKGAKNSQAKAVVCMTGIVNNYSQKIFPYMGAAEEWMKANDLTGANASRISQCCRGIKEFQGYGADGEKLKWRYLKDLSKEELKELLNKDLTNDEKEIVQKQLSQD